MVSIVSGAFDQNMTNQKMEWNFLPGDPGQLVNPSFNTAHPFSSCNLNQWDAAPSTSFDQFAPYNFVQNTFEDPGFDGSKLMDTFKVSKFTDTFEKGLFHPVNRSGYEGPDSLCRDEYLEDIPDCKMLDFDQVDDIFMNSLSDEDIRDMVNAVEPSQQVINPSNKALPFQDILANLLNDPTNNGFYQNGMETTDGPDASSFSLISEDLSLNSSMTSQGSIASDASTLINPRGSMTESRILVADVAKPKIFEATVLHELEAALSRINEKTRICFRDAFYRLASDSIDESNRESLEFHHGPSFNTSSRTCKMEPMETETTVIDRTVVNLLFDPSCVGPPETWAPHAFPTNTRQHVNYATL